MCVQCAFFFSLSLAILFYQQNVKFLPKKKGNSRVPVLCCTFLHSMKRGWINIFLPGRVNFYSNYFARISSLFFDFFSLFLMAILGMHTLPFLGVYCCVYVVKTQFLLFMWMWIKLANKWRKRPLENFNFFSFTFLI